MGIAIPALRTLGCVITGEEDQTQLAIDAGIIVPIGKLLNATKSSVRKEAGWALSNITAGTVSQIQEVINANIMGKIIDLAVNDSFDVRRECIWAVSNATSGGSDEQIKKLIELKAHTALSSILNTNEARTLAITLEGLDNILKKTKKFPDTVSTKLSFA